MANQEHLKILKQGVEVWNTWREENKEIRPDLYSANLIGVSLNDANLVGADLRRADLSGAHLNGVDLSEAHLSEAFLSETDLRRADLRRADLRSTFLNGADLRSTFLSGANLIGAHMSSANLIGAHLARTDLRRAFLNKADLRNTFLSETNLAFTTFIKTNFDKTIFDNAVLYNTVFSLTSLEGCLNLDKVIVHGECSIDFQTLRNSPNISKTFLRKIGLPELYIDYLPDFYDDKGLNLHPAFLSHSSENKEFARKLYNTLIDKGVLVWFDEKKFVAGDRLYETLSKSIDVYDKMILVCSEESLTSKWVIRELRKARKKEERLYKETGKELDVLIPISLDGYLFEWDNENQDFITERIVGDFSNWKDEQEFEKEVDKLVRALKPDRKGDSPPSLFNIGK